MRRAIVPPGSLSLGALELSPEAAHHVRDVLRLRADEVLELCDGAGVVARARLARVDRRGVLAVIDARTELPRPERPRLTLLQAVGKGDKLETVIRQATELGVARLVPVLTERAVAERSGKAARYAGVVEDALRVSRRAFAPVVEPPRALSEVLARPREELALALDGAASAPLAAVLSARFRGIAEALVGPEGGFTDAERTAIEAAGFLRVSLGPATLRTETAGCAIAAILAVFPWREAT